MAAYRYGKKKRILSTAGTTILSFLFFIGVMLLFLYAVSSISESTTERQQQALEDAIERSIVSCYCIEGTYPPSLDYLVEHYGLTYDKELFFVDYQAIGSNILPDVTIIRKEGKK